MSITLEKPETLEEENQKAYAIENADFPLASIDHRRFEKLTYWIYRKEIEVGSWKTLFDDIQLMSGVSDGAKDCALFLNKRMVGIIQCKHHVNNTSLEIPAFLKEVIKFCLYQIKHGGVIPDISEFVYYIASSSGFKEDCSKFIQNFNTESVNQAKLKKWSVTVINSYKNIEDLVYDEIEIELKDILSKLKVKPLDTQDINTALNKPYQSITQKAFFTVKMVVETASLIPIEKKLDKLLDKGLSGEEAMQAFKSASGYLINWKSYISENKKIKIERKQTQELYNWVKCTLDLNKEKPIALLTGSAGSGKTVVLKTLYDKLYSEGIIVLGIKADKYYANTIEGLERQLDIRESIVNLILKLKNENEKIVVLIDQIDALSQALSSDRKSLTTYNLLIQKLITIPGVRVIISVREFDLNYDPELRSYNSNTIIKLGILSDDEVRHVLQELEIDLHRISSKLFHTLKIPHHLEVFSNIYSKNISVEGLNELQDLYYELWRQKILTVSLESGAQSDKCIKLVYEVSQQMMDKQKISINYLSYENNYQKEIQYLTSQNIFIVSGKELQFFHQTFFDYTFARNFAEKNESVIDFVIKNNQSLHIRLSLKMILSYLRISNESKYIKDIEQFFLKSDIKFHLKLLIINLLGYNLIPLESEKKFVTGTLFKKNEYKNLFIESAFGEKWIDFLIDNGTLDTLVFTEPSRFDRISEFSIKKTTRLKELLENNFGYKPYIERRADSIDLFYNILSRSLPECRISVTQYLHKIDIFAEREKVVLRIIYLLKKWDAPEAFKLYEKFKVNIEQDQSTFLQILKDIIPYDLDFVVKVFSPWLEKMFLTIKEKNTTSNIRFDYHVNKIFEEIIKSNPEKGINLGLFFLKEHISERKYLYKNQSLELYEDFGFNFYNRKEKQHQGMDGIYNDLITAIEVLSKNNSTIFYDFINESVNENSVTILNILVWGFLANPSNYTEEIVDFIIRFEKKEGFLHFEKINFWIRKLIVTAYPFFNVLQRNSIHCIVLEIEKKEKPFSVLKEDGTRQYYLRSFGSCRYKYLSALPEASVLNDILLRKKYQELKRKFGAVKDRETNIINIRGVPPPLKSQAYDKMNFDNWENSMLKYSNEDSDIFSERGNLLEHSRKFQEHVKNDPKKYVLFIENMIDGDKVHRDYIVKGIEGLKDAQYNPIEVKRLFDKITSKTLDRSNTMYLVWLTEYFIKNKIVDQLLINFLLNSIKNFKTEQKVIENDLLSDAINSVRGAAIERLLMCTDDNTFIDTIFETAEMAAKDDHLNIKAILITRLPYLLKFNKKRTFSIFISAISNANETLLQTCTGSLSYMVHHGFEELIPHLKGWIKLESSQEDLGGILVNCWLYDYKSSKSLLFKLLKISPKARARAASFSYTNMFHEKVEIRKKCKWLYKYLLKDNSKEVSLEFENMFYKIEKEQFLDWFPLLKLYYKSRVVKKNPQHFFDYLLKNTLEYPKECLLLISRYYKYKRPNMYEGPYYSEEAVSIVLNCYNSFFNSADSINIEKCIRLFDSMLKTDYLRKGSYNALNLADK